MSNVRTVVVLGASPNPDRYSNMAVRLLRDHGHRVIPVNPGHDSIEELPAVRHLSDIKESVDTVTVYVNPDRVRQVENEIAALEPARVIFNPGTETSDVEDRLSDKAIDVVRACTLVMLNTGQF